MSGDFFDLPQDERDRLVNHYGRRILELCAENALSGSEVSMRLMERLALYAERNGNQDIVDAYRAQMRRKMN